MKLPEDNLDAIAGVRSEFQDRRERPRFTLLIRSAKLITESGEFLCIVRDVSQEGVRLRFFHPVPGCRHLRLALSTGDSFPIEQMWDNAGHAGFRFVNPVDVTHFIAEAGPYPKRPVRLKVEFPTTIVVGGRSVGARVFDISCQGARIETYEPLALKQKLRIESENLPDITATVCWRETPAYGLVFDHVLTLEDLAKRVARINLGERLDYLAGAPGEMIRSAV